MSPFSSDKKFCHRPGSFGTINSICLRCFVTVVKATSKEDVAKRELDHVCNPYDLERFKQAGASGAILR